jgi:hypothetical protein
MWEIVPIIGHCRTCGQNLSAEVRIRATSDWLTAYRADEALRRRVERAVVQRVIERHARACSGWTPTDGYAMPA